MEDYTKVGSNRTQTGHPQPAREWPSRKAQRRLAEIRADITAAAAEFESRWTRAALAAAEPELARRLAVQDKKWSVALAFGDEEEILKHGTAMARGYRACVDAMAAVVHPEDAYRVVETACGRVVTFGPKSCAAVLAERFPGSSHYTFEEAAELIVGKGVEAFPLTKSLFPGAEIGLVRKKGSA